MTWWRWWSSLSPPRRAACRRLRGAARQGDAAGGRTGRRLRLRGAPGVPWCVERGPGWRWFPGPVPVRRKAHRRRGSRCPCAHRLHAGDVGRAARADRPPLRPSFPPESSPRPAAACARRRAPRALRSGHNTLPGAGQRRAGWRPGGFAGVVAHLGRACFNEDGFRAGPGAGGAGGGVVSSPARWWLGVLNAGQDGSTFAPGGRITREGER